MKRFGYDDPSYEFYGYVVEKPDGEWYSAADVDARIAELEKALRDVRGELEACSGLRTEYQDWTDAFTAIDKALGL